MKFKCCLLFSMFFILVATITGQDSQTRCVSAGPSDILIQRDKETLRHLLFYLSLIEREKQGEEFRSHLESVTDASVISLANMLSSRADSVQNCVSVRQNLTENLTNGRFMLIVSMVFVMEKNGEVTKIIESWFDKNKNSVRAFGHGLLEIDSHVMVKHMSRPIKKKLEFWKGRNKNQPNHPVTLAARLLLGESPLIDESAMLVIPQFPLGEMGLKFGASDDFISLYRELYEIRKSTERLKILSDFYELPKRQ